MVICGSYTFEFSVTVLVSKDMKANSNDKRRIPGCEEEERDS